MKIKFALLLIIVVAHTAAFSKENDKNPFKRVYIGLSFTPEVSYRYLISNYAAPGLTNAFNHDAITVLNKNASPQFGVNGAIKVGINLTHWLAIESGIGYTLAQYKDQYNQSLSYWNGSSYTVTDSLTIKDKEIYHYMTIPIGLRLSFGKRKVKGIISAGVDLDFLIKQKEVNTNTDLNSQISSSSTTVQTKNFHTFNLSPYLGAGIDCFLTPAAVLRIMPVAQIQALKNINTPISEYLWNAGLNVSFFFGL